MRNRLINERTDDYLFFCKAIFFVNNSYCDKWFSVYTELSLLPTFVIVMPRRFTLLFSCDSNVKPRLGWIVVLLQLFCLMFTLYNNKICSTHVDQFDFVGLLIVVAVEYECLFNMVDEYFSQKARDGKTHGQCCRMM